MKGCPPHIGLVFILQSPNLTKAGVYVFGWGLAWKLGWGGLLRVDVPFVVPFEASVDDRDLVLCKRDLVRDLVQYKRAM
jgi:hypothetical protein